MYVRFKIFTNCHEIVLEKRRKKSLNMSIFTIGIKNILMFMCILHFMNCSVEGTKYLYLLNKC